MSTINSGLKRFSNPKTVSVIVCTRNRPKDIVRCLNSILDQTFSPHEIVVVDSSDSSATQLAINQLMSQPAIKLLYRHTRPGLTLQRNAGVKCSSGDLLIFLDDDVILEKEYLRGMLDAFESDAEGVVAGVQGSFTGIPSRTAFRQLVSRLFMLPGFTGLGRMQASGFPSYIAIPPAMIETDVICGGNTAYRREVFQQFKFNEDYAGYGYMEDDEFSYRVSQRYRLLQTPNAKLFHDESPASRDRIETRQRMDVMNHAAFFRENMPKGFIYRVAFAWSELGLSLGILRNFGIAVFGRRLLAYRDLFLQKQ